MQRDIPSFDKYTLSEQTKEALKTQDFDIWQWEPNEVSKNSSALNNDVHLNNSLQLGFYLNVMVVIHGLLCFQYSIFVLHIY